jgi:hypothetical protein
MLANSVTILSALAGLLGLVLWVRREVLVDYAAPPGRISTAVYRRLERARKILFRGSPSVRFTVFVPDPLGVELRPVARLGWGRAAAHSHARFKRGEGLAGLAWDKPEGIHFARLGPFSNEKGARQAQIKVLNLSTEAAHALSSDQLLAHVLIAAPIRCGEWIKGVLCIDCTDSTLIPETDPEQIPENGRQFWMEIARLATQLAPALRPSPIPNIDLRRVRSVDHASLEEVRLRPALHR